MSESLTNFEVINRQALKPPRVSTSGTYISALVSVDDMTTGVRAHCDPIGALHEIILFKARFEGRPVLGAFFVGENEVRVTRCETFEYPRR